MNSKDRRAVATATVGAAGVGGAAALRHTALERAYNKGKRPPVLQELKMLRNGTKGRGIYAAGLGLGAVSTPALAGGINTLMTREKAVAKAYKKRSFLAEGADGMKSSIKESTNTVREPPPAKLALANYLGGGAVTALSGAGINHKLKKVKLPGAAKAGIAAMGAVTAGASTLPIQSKVMGRVSGNKYETTAHGVRRKKTKAVRPSSAASMVDARGVPIQMGKALHPNKTQKRDNQGRWAKGDYSPADTKRLSLATKPGGPKLTGPEHPVIDSRDTAATWNKDHGLAAPGEPFGDEEYESEAEALHYDVKNHSRSVGDPLAYKATRIQLEADLAYFDEHQAGDLAEDADMCLRDTKAEHQAAMARKKPMSKAAPPRKVTTPVGSKAYGTMPIGRGEPFKSTRKGPAGRLIESHHTAMWDLQNRNQPARAQAHQQFIRELEAMPVAHSRRTLAAGVAGGAVATAALAGLHRKKTMAKKYIPSLDAVTGLPVAPLRSARKLPRKGRLVPGGVDTGHLWANGLPRIKVSVKKYYGEDMTHAQKRARVGAVTGLPFVSDVAQAAQAARMAPPQLRKQTALQTYGGGQAGGTAGTLAGAYGAAALARRSKRFEAGTVKVDDTIDRAKKHARSAVGLKPKSNKPSLRAKLLGKAPAKVQHAVTAAAKPLAGHGKAAAVGGLVLGAVGGVAGSQAGYGYALRAEDKYKAKIARDSRSARHGSRVAKAQTKVMSPREQAKLRRSKEQSALMSQAGGVIGLGALGATLGAKVPALGRKTATRLAKVPMPMLTAGAGLSGVNAFKYASIQHKEAAARVKKGLVPIRRAPRAVRGALRQTRTPSTGAIRTSYTRGGIR